MSDDDQTREFELVDDAIAHAISEILKLDPKEGVEAATDGALQILAVIADYAALQKSAPDRAAARRQLALLVGASIDIIHQIDALAEQTQDSSATNPTQKTSAEI